MNTAAPVKSGYMLHRLHWTIQLTTSTPESCILADVSQSESRGIQNSLYGLGLANTVIFYVVVFVLLPSNTPDGDSAFQWLALSAKPELQVSSPEEQLDTQIQSPSEAAQGQS